MEQTLVLVKPDGVSRGIIGEIIHRFERAGLKIVAMKMVWPTEQMADEHYPKDEKFKRILGSKTLSTYQENGMDPMAELGMSDELEIGEFVRSTLIRSLTWGPVVALVLEGNHVVAQVRQMTGSTMPSGSAPGTIRGDFSVDSAALANAKKRAVRNIIHASGEIDEAKHEIALWFKPEEIVSYKRADEDVMFEPI
jgi:nucleoside-diphosphate kinase